MNVNTLQNSESSYSVSIANQNQTRPRKCCPFCGSTRVSRRVRAGGWHCNNTGCKKSFTQPALKEVAARRGRPPALVALLKGVTV